MVKQGYEVQLHKVTRKLRAILVVFFHANSALLSCQWEEALTEKQAEETGSACSCENQALALSLPTCGAEACSWQPVDVSPASSTRRPSLPYGLVKHSC